jgi:hypothetical protein
MELLGMKAKIILVATLLCLAPTLSLAESTCNTTMKQAQAYGSLTLDCSVGFFEGNKQNNSRRACAKLKVPGNIIISASTKSYSTKDMSDIKLRDKVCLDAAMKYAETPQ